MVYHIFHEVDSARRKECYFLVRPQICHYWVFRLYFWFRRFLIAWLMLWRPSKLKIIPIGINEGWKPKGIFVTFQLMFGDVKADVRWCQIDIIKHQAFFSTNMVTIFIFLGSTYIMKLRRTYRTNYELLIHQIAKVVVISVKWGAPNPQLRGTPFDSGTHNCGSTLSIDLKYTIWPYNSNYTSCIPVVWLVVLLFT